MAPQFDYRANIGKSGLARGLNQRCGQAVIVDMHYPSATVTDEENTVVTAAGMRVDDIGIGTFDSARQVGTHEQVQNAIDAVGGNAFAARCGNPLGDVVSRYRPVTCC